MINLIKYHIIPICTHKGRRHEWLTWLSCLTLPLAMDASSCSVFRIRSFSASCCADGSNLTVDCESKTRTIIKNSQTLNTERAHVNLIHLPCTRHPKHWDSYHGAERRDWPHQSLTGSVRWDSPPALWTSPRSSLHKHRRVWVDRIHSA